MVRDSSRPQTQESVDDEFLNQAVGQFVRKFGGLEMVLIHFVARFLLPKGMVDSRAQQSAELVARRLQTRDLLDCLKDLGEHWFGPGPQLDSLKDLVQRARDLNDYRNRVVHTPPTIANVWENGGPMQKRTVQSKGRKRKPRDSMLFNDFSVDDLREQTERLQDLINEGTTLLTNLTFVTDR